MVINNFKLMEIMIISGTILRAELIASIACFLCPRFHEWVAERFCGGRPAARRSRVRVLVWVSFN